MKSWHQERRENETDLWLISTVSTPFQFDLPRPLSNISDVKEIAATTTATFNNSNGGDGGKLYLVSLIEVESSWFLGRRRLSSSPRLSAMALKKEKGTPGTKRKIARRVKLRTLISIANVLLGLREIIICIAKDF